MIETILVVFFAALGLGEGIGQGALGALLALLLWKKRGDFPSVWRQPYARALAAIILWAIATMAINGWPRSSESTKLFDLLPLVVVPWALTCMSAPLRQRALTAFVVAAVLSSLYGVLQYRFGVDWGAAYLRGSPAHYRIPTFVDADRFAAGGFFYNRLKLAHVLVAALCFGFFAWRPKHAAAAGLALAAILVGLLLTFARAPVAALAVGLAVAAIFSHDRRLRRLVLALFAVCAAVVSIVPSVRTRLLSAADPAAYGDRVFLWQRAIEIIRDHPWLGIGYGNYSKVCGAYYDRVDPTFAMRSTAHNHFLTVLAEGGPIALGLWIWLLVAMLIGLKRQSDARLRAAGIALFVAQFILFFVHDPLWLPAVALCFTACLGLALAESPPQNPPTG